jgi:hypothetical protein
LLRPNNQLLFSDSRVGSFSDEVIRPDRITKKRVRNGNPCFDITWTSVDENSKFLPPSFETCEPAVFVTLAYPKLVSDFEDLLNAKLKPKKKPAGTKKTKAGVEKEAEVLAEQQPAITQFFTQNKVTAGPSKKVETQQSLKPKVVATKTEIPPKKISAPIKIIPATKVFGFPVPQKSVPKSKVPTKAPEGPPSPIVLHKDVLRLQHQTSFGEMSVDPSDVSCLSDLSMIIDDFMSRKIEVLNLDSKVPQIADPTLTSTPRGNGTRETIRKVPNNEDMSLDESDLQIKNVFTGKQVLPMKVVEKDSSMISVNDTAEDSFDRMCK